MVPEVGTPIRLVQGTAICGRLDQRYAGAGGPKLDRTAGANAVPSGIFLN